jgi:hypothetical protein
LGAVLVYADVVADNDRVPNGDATGNHALEKKDEQCSCHQPVMHHGNLIS